MAQKPWLQSYDPGVPATLAPYPEITLLDILAETVQQRLQHPALLFKGARMSGAALEQLSTDLAAALVAQGVKKGDRVALLLPNCPQAIIGHFGIWKAGAIAVPMNPLYAESELEHLLNECGAEIAIVLTPFYGKMKSIQSRTPLRRVIATNIKEYLPPILRFLFTLAKEKKEGHRITLQTEDRWLQALLRQYSRSRRPDVAVSPKEPAIFLFSGGTTGVPKGAIGSHQALVMSGMQLHAWFGVVLKDWDDLIMQVMPLFHVYGNAGVMATALVGHNPLVLVPNPRDIKDLIHTIRKVRPAFLPGVPTLFIALLNHPDVRAGKVDFRSMKLCISGAAALLAETKKDFEELTGGRMVEGYGLTESMMAAIVNPVKGTYKVGSIGLPVPDVEVRIADAETGEGSLPPGERGEILLKAPQLMLEYWQRPAATAQVIHEGWLHTGDIGYMDEDGYIFIVERKKDLIKAGGFQVWPREIEEVIATIPAVAEVAAAGVPDPYRGETVKVWIVLKSGQKATEDNILAVCREKLAPYKVPKLIEFRESLPKTMVGKVLRRQLVEEHKQKQAAG
ncbi:MAG: long-chain fatty acid--CoA ligase [Chloroflexi bacterium]|nr:long-chain fatty acid--CoA ligase [Chloroflexota bacterium]